MVVASLLLLLPDEWCPLAVPLVSAKPSVQFWAVVSEVSLVDVRVVLASDEET